MYSIALIIDMAGQVRVVYHLGILYSIYSLFGKRRLSIVSLYLSLYERKRSSMSDHLIALKLLFCSARSYRKWIRGIISRASHNSQASRSLHCIIRKAGGYSPGADARDKHTRGSLTIRALGYVRAHMHVSIDCKPWKKAQLIDDCYSFY